jgi:hypothetical protein
MRVVLSAIETAARQHAHTFFPKISDGAGSSNTTYIVSVQAATWRGAGDRMAMAGRPWPYAQQIAPNG